MVAFPNCKINLGLNVISKREDNYHELQTVFYPLNFFDVLEIISTSNNGNEFTVTGLPIFSDQNNLCLKAYELVKKRFPDLSFVKMHLHKAIPAGAGLGGGSSNGAFTLKLLNEKFLLNLSNDQLMDYALQLGSDCPFFLYNKPCIASGLGEHFEPIDIDLSSCKILLVNPGIHINTAWAFSKIKPEIPQKSLKEIIRQPVETWKHELLNDFEIIVFETYPEIKKIKENLYEYGAFYASLSGSGSTVYGIFNNTDSIAANFPPDYFTREINLK